MKKLLSIGLISILLLSATGCHNSEIEELKQENAELKKQVEELKNPTTTNSPQSKNDITILEQKVSDTSLSAEYIDVDYTIQNNTNSPINTLTLRIKELDESGNIISTAGAQDSVEIAPGQSLTMQSTHKKEVVTIQIDSYWYYVGDEYVEHRMNDAQKLNLH